LCYCFLISLLTDVPIIEPDVTTLFDTALGVSYDVLFCRGKFCPQNNLFADFDETQQIFAADESVFMTAIKFVPLGYAGERERPLQPRVHAGATRQLKP
jgi:hypothetical protein